MSYGMYAALNSLAMTFSIFYLIPKRRNDRNFYLLAIGVMLFFVCFHSFNYRFEVPERLLRGFLLGVVVILVGLLVSKVNPPADSKINRE